MNGFRKAGYALCLLIAIMCVVFLLIAEPQKAQAADTNRYGYKMLDSDRQRQAYVQIADALISGASEVSMPQGGIPLEEFVEVLDLVRNDYAEIPGIDGYSYVPQGNMVVSAEFRYTIGGSVQSAIAALDSKASQIASGAKGSDYQKALYLHDYIVKNVDYQQTGDHQSAYGALIEGKAVCAGYTRAYQLLLRKAGIDSFYIEGKARKANGSQIEHAWLLVFLDGECYYTDVTWDDARTESGTPLTGHYYFNMSYDDIAADHVANAKYSQWLPGDHSHWRLNYFEQEKKEGSGVGWFNSSSAPETLYSYLKKDGNTYTCDFRYDGNDVSQWLNSAMQSISNNFTNIQSTKCEGIGHEYLLSFTAEPRQHTPGGWESDAANHWQKCTACNAVIDGTSAAHTDGNGDLNCDVCGYKLPGGASSVQGTLSSGAASSAPSGGTNGPAADNSVSSDDETGLPNGEGITSAEDDSSSVDSTKEPIPSGTDEAITPSEDSADVTVPSSDAEGDPTTPKQDHQKSGGGEENGSDGTVWIVAVGAVAVLGGAGAAVAVIIRRKRVHW